MILSSGASLRPRLLVEPMPEAASPWPPRPGLAASEPPRGRILLVEPNAVVALDLQRTLRQAGWRTVGPACSVAEVGTLVARGRVDAAAVDLDGLGDLGAEIAQLLAETGIPFVFLTAGRDRVPDRHQHRPVVDKPYTGTELVDALERAIGRDDIVYPLTPPVSWPRVFPQL